MDRVRKVRARLTALVVFSLPAYAFLNVWFPTIPLQERATLGLLAVLAYFLSAESRTPLGLALHAFHTLLAVAVFGYLIVDWEELLLRQGAPNTMDIVLGIAGVYLIMVATVRSLGLGLAAVVALFLAYTFLGQYLPAWLGGHRGYSLSRTFTFLYISENGVMGFAMDAALKFMALFLVLGKVLQNTGALSFIMDLARAVFGRGTTGPPLMTVFASGLVGTVTGSAMGDVYITGQVTIPLMKRVGVKPELAAAITATAANGAQIMPPVMGFAVFFMVVLLDVSYFEIMKAAIIPALFYFLTVGVAVWVRARRIPPSADAAMLDETRPTVAQAIMRMGALSFVATLATLIFLLARQDALQMAAIYAMAACIGLSMFGRDRMTPSKALDTVRDSGKEMVEVTIVCLALGLVTGPILLTGLGTKLPALMMNWAAGDLTLLLMAAFVASMILGMGVPTSMAYVIVALLITTAITELGVPKLDAHMFVFYAALAAMITPPVALAAYAAASLAGANYWTTGWLAAIIGMPKYLVPFAFIYRPELLMRGDPLDIIAVALLSGAGLMIIGCGLGVKDYRSWRGAARMLTLCAGGFLLAVPPWDTLVLAVGAALSAIGALPLLFRLRAVARIGHSLPLQ